jgi:hypothetical protein
MLSMFNGFGTGVSKKLYAVRAIKVHTKGRGSIPTAPSKRFSSPGVDTLRDNMRHKHIVRTFFIHLFIQGLWRRSCQSTRLSPQNVGPILTTGPWQGLKIFYA